MKFRSFWIWSAKTRFLLLFIFVFLCPQTRSDEAVIINLSEKAEVSGKKILLGKIAEIKCNDPKQLQELKQLEIDISPSLGRTIKIDLYKIKWQLRRADFDIEKFKFGENPKVIVESKSMTLTDEQLFSAVKTFLMQKLEGKAEKVNLSPARIPDKTVLPFGKLKLVPRLADSARYKTVHIKVDVLIDDEKYRTINLSVNLSGTYKVLIAKKNINRHEKVSLEDFVEKKLVMDGVRELSITPEILVNARSRRSIRKGEIITSDELEPIPQIISGSIVTIIAQIHGVTVSAIGKALEDGYAGQAVRVINLRSKKSLEGIVSSENRVEVKTFAMPY